MVLTLGCENSSVEKTLKYPTSIVAGHTSGESIMYTHFDTLISIDGLWNPTYQFDLNEDEINDFGFSSYRSISPGGRHFILNLEPFGQNMIAVSDSNQAWVDTISMGQYIDNQLIWRNSRLILLNRSTITAYPGGSDYWYGLWVDTKRKYIGVKIVTDDKFYYGWIKVNIYPYFVHLYVIEVESYAITKPY